MKQALAIALCVLAACTVDRASTALECTDSSTCMNGRSCISGYCVEGTGCPAACDSCDTTQDPPVCMVTNPGGNFTCPTGINCAITCTSNNSCVNLTCASGASCTITCSATNACHSIACDGTSCTVECMGTNACHDVTCGDGDNGSCNLTCLGNSACGTVSCPNACSCDLTCPLGCTDVTCPTGCMAGPSCSSSLPNCNSC